MKTQQTYWKQIQNKPIAKDASLTGLPTRDPNDEPTKAQCKKWRREYSKQQGGALKIVKALSATPPQAQAGKTVTEICGSHWKHDLAKQFSNDNSIKPTPPATNPPIGVSMPQGEGIDTIDNNPDASRQLHKPTSTGEHSPFPVDWFTVEGEQVVRLKDYLQAKAQWEGSDQ